MKEITSVVTKVFKEILFLGFAIPSYPINEFELFIVAK